MVSIKLTIQVAGVYTCIAEVTVTKVCVHIYQKSKSFRRFIHLYMLHIFNMKQIGIVLLKSRKSLGEKLESTHRAQTSTRFFFHNYGNYSFMCIFI